MNAAGTKDSLIVRMSHVSDDVNYARRQFESALRIGTARAGRREEIVACERTLQRDASRSIFARMGGERRCAGSSHAHGFRASCPKCSERFGFREVRLGGYASIHNATRGVLFVSTTPPVA